MSIRSASPLTTSTVGVCGSPASVAATEATESARHSTRTIAVSPTPIRSADG
ncbi:putative membrane protein YadS [Streptacidiphilus sp. MAP12-20]